MQGTHAHSGNVCLPIQGWLILFTGLETAGWRSWRMENKLVFNCK